MMVKRSRRLSLRLVGFVVIGSVFVVLVAVILLSQRAASAAPPQPISFSHRIHDQASVQCLYCHPNAMRSDIAGIPSVQKCVGCHKTIAVDRPEIQTVLGYWEREDPIPWQSVVNMADHVFFSHQPHLGAGVSCETCHGDVRQMTVAGPVVNMDMGWCLDCHVEQPEDKVAKLADCLTCHK